MREKIDSAIVMAIESVEKVGAPRPLHIAISLTVGMLVALVAGILHRSDRPNPATPHYSVQSAVMRAGVALFGVATLTLATLMSPESETSFLILLLSAVAASVYGLLAYFDTTAPSRTIQAAIWRGATVAASASGLGQTFLALYSGR